MSFARRSSKPRIKRKTPEKSIQNAILEYLSWQKECIAMPIDTVGMYDPLRKRFRKKKPNRGNIWYTGVADILVFHRRLGMIAIEVKSSSGVMSDVQKEFRSAIIAVGAHHILARSVDDVSRFITVALELLMDDLSGKRTGIDRGALEDRTA